MAERIVTLDLGTDDSGSELQIAVVADQVGSQLVADQDISARLGDITASIERVSREMLEAAKRAGPSKASVELTFGLTVEAGRLLALFGKVSGDASIKVILEWSTN